jgi:16S rRNA (cytosine967-C5)-methyltransferase
VSKNSAKNPVNTRALAAQAVHQVIRDGRSLTQVLPDFKKKCTQPQDAAFLQAMIYGTLRFYPTLAFLGDKLLDKPIKDKDFILYDLIMVGLYQLIHMRVPAHAALSATVEGARVLQRPWATGLVNGILRNFQRKRDALQQALSANEEAYYAHPSWLIEVIKTAWPTEWQTILTANNAAPPFSLRVNLRKITREKFLETLQEAGILATALSNTLAGVVLEVAIDVANIPGFKEGLFSVQDAAAQYAAELLHLSPNLRVLDACAAPGGKTLHLLEKEPNLKEVVAIDISPARTNLIKENLERMTLSATVITANAMEPETWWNKTPFDRILLDAPCSATGVIRRHPDIKYCRQLNDVEKLAEQQGLLLSALWPLLNPGGYLLYVTCSIIPTENVRVLENFLSEHTDALNTHFVLADGTQQSIGTQILPGQNNLDGFYYACLQKKISEC